eukprot:5467505-Pyramimonas_sp.AAC.1
MIECVDGDLVVAIGQGTLPGDTVACLWFLGAYNTAIDRFRDSDAVGIYVTMKWLRHCIVSTEEAKRYLNVLARESLDISVT